MKFSVNWISEFTGRLDLSGAELAQLITIKTAEQEGVEAVGPFLAQVCAARVISTAPIEGSKNVSVVADTGRYGRKSVVCGAPNCRPGMITAYVPSGVTLQGKQIRRALISGVESDGMLASGAELGLNRDSAGILEFEASPGDPVPGCCPDSVIEIDNKSLTHRPDLWGHFGMAREVAAITGSRLSDPVKMDRVPGGQAAIQVLIEDTTLCPRYSALVFDNVEVRPSPLWLQYRLEAVGLNPINNIVDVTNYVMAELAQPMHAFDRDKLRGGAIHVRLARTGERLTALDNEEYGLDPQTLLITDDAGPVAIAGVIGGLATGVTAETRRIVLESANFHPASVRKTSARLKIRTDASMRFEKAQDPVNTTRALARAAELLEIVSPGIRITGGLADSGAPLAAAPQIQLPLDWLRRKLGRPVSADEVRGILESLGFDVAGAGDGLFSVTVPSWRATKDISIKDDLVEEAGRMLSYGSITPTAPAVPATPPPADPTRDFLRNVRTVCVNQGFTEVYNYSFVNEEQAAELGFDLADHVKVVNPIASDQGLLRTSLLAGIVKNVRSNSRHLEEFRFFETGNEVHRTQVGVPNETPHLAACVYSKAGNGEAGLHEVKRLAECLARGAEVRPAPARSCEHPVRAWEVIVRGEAAGRIFELHPKLVDGRAAVLDLDLTHLLAAPVPVVRYQPLLRYPSSEFDLSILTGLRTLTGEIAAHLRENTGPMLQRVDFVTQYAGPPLPADRKSVSFRITIGAADRTLSSAEITGVRASLIQSMRDLGYELRA
ncbi:MAG: phenylalanine--tRNA ligase subunit beta [Acidobacteria bacterium]|nr:phenylalanine--tRNA ligase subunit beta [Acidobacteriota bacterium]